MVTALIAVIGLAILALGLIGFLCFGQAVGAFSRPSAAGACAAVRGEGAARTGEAFPGRTVAAVASAAARGIGPAGAGMAGTAITDLLEDKRSIGKRVALLGATVPAGFFVAGPWLTNLIARG